MIIILIFIIFFKFYLDEEKEICEPMVSLEHFDLSKFNVSLIKYNVIQIGPKENFGENFYLAAKNSQISNVNIKFCEKIENEKIISDMKKIDENSFLFTCPQPFDEILFSNFITNKFAFFNFFF